MLYVFDKDNTLVSGMGNRPANTPDEQTLLPGVAEKISELRARGHHIAIASNQGGVAWGFITMERARELMIDCAEKIGGANYEFCPHDDRKNAPCGCRKPRPGMLINLMRKTGCLPAETVMVGDQDTDRQAAEAAGAHFEWAQEFFR